MRTKSKKTPSRVAAPLFVVDPLSPTALTGDVTDYNPAGLAGATIVRLDSGSVDVDIFSLATGVEGRILTIMNVGTSNSIALRNQYTTGTTAAMRFIGPNGQDIVIRYGGACTIIYDGESSRWRALSATRF